MCILNKMRYTILLIFSKHIYPTTLIVKLTQGYI